MVRFFFVLVVFVSWGVMAGPPIDGPPAPPRKPDSPKHLSLAVNDERPTSNNDDNLRKIKSNNVYAQLWVLQEISKKVPIAKIVENLENRKTDDKKKAAEDQMKNWLLDTKLFGDKPDFGTPPDQLFELAELRFKTDAETLLIKAGEKDSGKEHKIVQFMIAADPKLKFLVEHFPVTPEQAVLFLKAIEKDTKSAAQALAELLYSIPEENRNGLLKGFSEVVNSWEDGSKNKEFTGHEGDSEYRNLFKNYPEFAKAVAFAIRVEGKSTIPEDKFKNNEDYKVFEKAYAEQKADKLKFNKDYNEKLEAIAKETNTDERKKAQENLQKQVLGNNSTLREVINDGGTAYRQHLARNGTSQQDAKTWLRDHPAAKEAVSSWLKAHGTKTLDGKTKLYFEVPDKSFMAERGSKFGFAVEVEDKELENTEFLASLLDRLQHPLGTDSEDKFYRHKGRFNRPLSYYQWGSPTESGKYDTLQFKDGKLTPKS